MWPILLFTYVSAVLAAVPVTQEHFYTTNQTEADGTAVNLGFVIEGIAGQIYQTSHPSAVPMYRLYNSGISRHFYTINETERSGLIASGQWVNDDKPLLGYCFPTSASVQGGQKFYRLYNAAIADHLYTTSSTEVQSAREIGYVLEITACILPATGDGTVPVLRLLRKCLQGQNPENNCAAGKGSTPTTTSVLGDTSTSTPATSTTVAASFSTSTDTGTTLKGASKTSSTETTTGTGITSATNSSSSSASGSTKTSTSAASSSSTSLSSGRSIVAAISFQGVALAVGCVAVAIF